MDRRRGARIPARFWLRVAEVDSEPALRRGDISMSGMYVETDRAFGDPGSVQRVTIEPFGRQSTVEVLARVVRTITVLDVWNGPSVGGVALEFLLENSDKRAEIEEVIRAVMASKSYVAESVDIGAAFESQVDPQALVEPAGATGLLGVSVLVLETSWPLKVGDAVRLVIDAPGCSRRAALAGWVTRTSEPRSGAGAGLQRVEIDFQRTADSDQRAAMAAYQGPSITDALDALLEEVVFPEENGLPPRPRTQLTGALSRIRLPSLLAFFEFERLSGVLSLARAATRARVFVREGQVVDVEATDHAGTPLAQLEWLCGWDDADFDFQLEAVDRPDRFGMKTSAVILELARLSDEGSERTAQ